MNDFFEIDFLDVEAKKSGDAIAIRYSINNISWIHVVDGGYQDTGTKLVEHIRKYYGNPTYIDHVVATHPDGDHAGGLRSVLEEFKVGTLWMLRAWNYADELLPRFARFTSVENLKNRLKEIYPNIAALETIAIERGIPMQEPFQGAKIGAFTVMAPTKSRYLDLVVDSEKTPQSVAEASLKAADFGFREFVKAAVAFVRSLWGEEVFSTDWPGAENEMSVVQFANLLGIKVLLTADAGRDGLTEAANFAPSIGLVLPGIDRFQVPHHGSRRNVSTEVLDRWLGKRLPAPPIPGQESFNAIISAAKADEDHPRKAVIRAMIHRGARVASTKEQGSDICSASTDAPTRVGWGPAPLLPYPEEQEE